MQSAMLLVALLLPAGSALAQDLRDPMAPPRVEEAQRETKAPSEPSAGLQAVIQGPGRSVAVINGTIVEPGDRLPGDGRLIALEPDSATVQSGGERKTLKLHPSSIEKSPSR